jgi:hypothetical protein
VPVRAPSPGYTTVPAPEDPYRLGVNGGAVHVPVFMCVLPASELWTRAPGANCYLIRKCSVAVAAVRCVVEASVGFCSDLSEGLLGMLALARSTDEFALVQGGGRPAGGGDQLARTAPALRRQRVSKCWRASPARPRTAGIRTAPAPPRPTEGTPASPSPPRYVLVSVLRSPHTCGSWM